MSFDKVTDIDLREDELDDLFSLIHRQHGYDFSGYAKASMKRRIGRIIQVLRFNSIAELKAHFEAEPQFIKDFISELTVGVTEMFRDPEAWMFFREYILPLYAEQDRVDAWHAGCSTGEEVYSLRILFDEAGMADQLHQFATDINPNYLDIAQQGLYPYRKIELYSKNYKQYNPEGNFSQYHELNTYNAIMREDLKKQTEYGVYDLVYHKPLETQYDLIFCRNVLIYFENELQDELLLHFYKSLKPGGWLVMGQFESLVWCSNYSKFNQPNNHINIIRKKP